jgi:hypothetical protein
LYISIFLILYWLTSIFVFLFKKNQYNSFTASSQRFWKRALYLFWLLELSLFLVFFFLIFIAPQESLFVLDYSEQYFSYIMNLHFFFKNLLKIVMLILSINILILLLKYRVLKNFILFIIFLQLFIITLEDFQEFYGILKFYNSFKWKFDDKTNVWNYEVAVLKLRTYFHYIMLLIFLKFWHTLFIFFCFLKNEIVRLDATDYSFGSVSFNVQNFYFLLLFTIITKIFLIKSFLMYYFQYVYYWFNINNHFFDLHIYYMLLNKDYVLYFLNDFSKWFFC